MKVRVLTVLLILVFSLCLTARPVVAAEQVRKHGAASGMPF